MMRRCNQITGLLLLVFSIFVVYGASKLVYTVEFSPGAGFFPVWLGICLGVLSLILLLNNSVFKRQETDEALLPGKKGLLRIVFIMGTLLVSILLIERLGYVITMILFIVLLLTVLERYRWYSGTLIAALMVFAMYGLFKIWLGVPLPLGLFR